MTESVTLDGIARGWDEVSDDLSVVLDYYQRQADGTLEPWSGALVRLLALALSVLHGELELPEPPDELGVMVERLRTLRRAALGLQGGPAAARTEAATRRRATVDRLLVGAIIVAELATKPPPRT